jgi:glycosyltransferase involved in cell wall biosynthesis
LRILAITPYCEPEGGGLERYAQAILTRLARDGHEVELHAFTNEGAPSGERSGIDVHLRRPALRLGNTPVHPGFSAELRDAIRRRRPDVVLAHTPVPFPAEMAYLAARREGVPFVVTYHAGRLRGSSPPLAALAALDRSTFERAMLRGADGLIAVTPYVRDNALARQRERVTIIPPGVDHANYTPLRGRAAAGKSAAGILFVGPLDRSYRWKGLDVLWEAFQEVRRARPDATLTLVGRGDRAEEFRDIAGRDPAVVVKGRLSDGEIVGEYRKAAVLALPSTTDAESFGMVLAEANACGTPVVASRVGGIPSFVRDGDNGWLVRPGDARDLAARLLHVIDHPDEARILAEQGRRRVVAEHDWDDLARGTASVLEDAVARHARRLQARPVQDRGRRPYGLRRRPKSARAATPPPAASPMANGVGSSGMVVTSTRGQSSDSSEPKSPVTR